MFMKTLGKGEKKLHQMLDEALLSAEKSGSLPCLPGKDVFLLKDTYGFPPLKKQGKWLKNMA